MAKYRGDLGIYALNETQLQIYFEGKIDYEQFLLKLTSHALAPLREEIVTRNDDWAKKPSTICSSGPFKIRKVSFVEDSQILILERNQYYYRNASKDPVTKSVLPYRIIVDYTKTAEEIMQMYENGEIFYVGDIPLSMRGAYKDKANIMDALSTHAYVLNQNAVVRYYDEKIAAEIESSTSPYGIRYVENKTTKKNEIVKEELVEGEDGEKILANNAVRTSLGNTEVLIATR